MSDTAPYSEATVELVAEVVEAERGCFPSAIAARVLDALATAGRLVPEGARTEYGVEVTYPDGEPIALPAVNRYMAEKSVRAGSAGGFARHVLVERTTWSTPWRNVTEDPATSIGPPAGDEQDAGTARDYGGMD